MPILLQIHKHLENVHIWINPPGNALHRSDVFRGSKLSMEGFFKTALLGQDFDICYFVNSKKPDDE